MFSLSSEYPDTCPVLWRHTAPVFLSFSTTTKSSSLVGLPCRRPFPNQQICRYFPFYLYFSAVRKANIGSVVELPFLKPNWMSSSSTMCLILWSMILSHTFLVYPTPSWCITHLPGVSHTFLVCPTPSWCVSHLPGVSHTFLVCPTPSWCVPRLPGVSHTFMVCPTPSWCVPHLPGVSHTFLVCPTPSWCVPHLPGVSHTFMVCAINFIPL